MRLAQQLLPCAAVAIVRGARAGDGVRWIGLSEGDGKAKAPTWFGAHIERFAKFNSTIDMAWLEDAIRDDARPKAM